jgi:hypothetical protein
MHMRVSRLGVSKKNMNRKNRTPFGKLGQEDAPERWTPSVVAIAATIVFCVIAVTIVLGLVSRLVHLVLLEKEIIPLVDNAACPPANDRGCQAGAVITAAGGEGLCQYYDYGVGTSCSSACYVDGTATLCDSQHNCSNANSTACLGYCDALGGSIVYEPDDCEGKLTFLKFFSNTVDDGVSKNPYNWLQYTEYDPECWADGGCTWYSTILEYRSTQEELTVQQAAFFTSCLDVLNMTNSECISARRIDFTDDFAARFYKNAYVSEDQYQGYGCIYSYACGPHNVTWMEDPDYLYDEKKRVVGDVSSSLHSRYATATMSHFDNMKKQWAKYTR